MEFKFCKLTPTTPLHLGEREFWREGSSVFIHSDTLFSGICHCYGLLYGKDELEEFIKGVKDDQILKISSAFPVWDNIFYFPVPKNQIPEDKDAYRIQFIEQQGFEQLLAGNKLEQLVAEKIRVIPRLEKDEKPATPWRSLNVLRITLSRFNNHPTKEGGFFHSGRVTYRDDAGLFFLYQTDNAEIENRFKAAIYLLADEGIGGDRSCGNGLMKKPEFQEKFVLNVAESAKLQISLSLYFPADQDEEMKSLSSGYYELLERKGYIYSPQGQSLRRRSVRMFTEGSVFPAIANRSGTVENVTPGAFSGKHQVYRYGLFFGVPCREEVIEA